MLGDKSWARRTVERLEPGKNGGREGRSLERNAAHIKPHKVFQVLNKKMPVI